MAQTSIVEAVIGRAVIVQTSIGHIWIHHPVRCLIALLALVVLVFSIDRFGLLTWIAWLNRRANHQDNGSKEYWRLHQ
jgi:hypothetical protein